MKTVLLPFILALILSVGSLFVMPAHATSYTDNPFVAFDPNIPSTQTVSVTRQYPTGTIILVSLLALGAFIFFIGRKEE